MENSGPAPNDSQKSLIPLHVLADTAGKVLDRWTIMSREEEIITLQQFLRFGETKSIVELMAIQEKEGQAVTVPSSKTDSGIRTFIESNNRTRSPGLLTHLENSSPSSIHHFENIPNSLAFLLPFQYINPVSAPMLGLPPNGLALEQAALRQRSTLSNQSEPVESSDSEVSLSPFRSSQSPNRGTTGSIPGTIEPKTEPNGTSPVAPSPAMQQQGQSQQQGPQTSQPAHQVAPQPRQTGALNEHQAHHHFVKSEESKIASHSSSSSSSFSSKMHRMRRLGTPSRKGRVCCNACGKTFYDKGTLKIHYNAVHLKIKHRCTIEGCNMVFSSLRSRNRHSANPNPRLHMPMLRNNRDKDLIRSNSGSAAPVISNAKSGFALTSPGRPPLGFATPPLDPMMHSPLQSPLVFPSLKSVQPVQPVPPFYRTLLSPADMVSPPVSLPTSPILPPATSGTSLMDQHQQVLAVSSNSAHLSDRMVGGMSHHLATTPSAPDPATPDPTPKKKPRKSSMPVKIEKEVVDVVDDYDDKDEDDEDSCHYHHLHSVVNGNCNNNNNSGGSGHQSPSQDEMSPGLVLRNILHPEQDECRAGASDGGASEMRCVDSFTSEDQDHERDFENESETSESKVFYRDEMMDAEEQRHVSGGGGGGGGGRGLDKGEGEENGRPRKDAEDDSRASPSLHQPAVKIKEELSDPTYDMFCMSQYGLYNGSMAAAAAASMAALHESFISSMAYGASPPKIHSQSPEGDLCASPDPKICYVCKKSFKSSYSVKLHYKNVHLKEMHVCTVAGCNAAFPSRRSRDRHSSNINLHRKLLTKELDDIILDPRLTPLPKDLRAEILARIYGAHHLGLEGGGGPGGPGAVLVRSEEAASPVGTEYFHGNGYRGNDDYAVLDLSTTSSVQSSDSVHSSHDSDEGSDEGVLLDDLEASEAEDGGVRGDVERGAEGGVSGEGLTPADPSSSPSLVTSVASGNGVGGGILCTICHKLYSNKGTLRVHYKTVHLREMHKCRVPGCNMMFSSVRSRNRHSQNPNLHKNTPVAVALE
ncbi:hypothetical protein P4O66_002042 [Electrophorus voltai]|uniref:C2H2-type domain-containing protein n=1 Tax=Electrophorus voltai TaxID=2609070 RepID=A0AAD8Z4E0_9TELE|nr:hypothetical protein P4O66_002042 [Electrophorus voltai]